MKHLLSILVSTALVNNFVVVKFLGLCPVMGVSKNINHAFGMSLATAFVLTMSAGCSSLIAHYFLIPLQLEFLQLIVFIFIIAIIVQATEMVLRAFVPLLHQVLGIYLPLITTNCAVLGVALLNYNAQHDFVESLYYGFGTGIGFGLILILFASLRERLQSASVPSSLQGTPIALITLGIISLGFLGFSGLVTIT